MLTQITYDFTHAQSPSDILVQLRISPPAPTLNQSQAYSSHSTVPKRVLSAPVVIEVSSGSESEASADSDIQFLGIVKVCCLGLLLGSRL